MKYKNILPVILTAGCLLAGHLYAQKPSSFLEKAKTSGFLEEVKNESRETVYFENEKYSIVESSDKLNITPAPADEFAAKAVIFTYLTKKSLDEIVEPVGKLNREIKKLMEELVDESYSFYTTTGIQIFDDNDLVELANMSTPYENWLTKSALQNFDVLVSDVNQKKIDWKQTMYDYLNLSSTSDELRRESLERKIEQKETLKDIDDRRKATLSYSIQNGIEQIANECAEYYIMNKANPSASEIAEAASKAVNGNSMNYVGFVDPRLPTAVRALSCVMFFDKLLDKNEVNFSEFSYEDAKKLYFSPQIHKEKISELYAYAKHFEGMRKSELKGEVPAFKRWTGGWDCELLNDGIFAEELTNNIKDSSLTATFSIRGKWKGLLPYTFVLESPAPTYNPIQGFIDGWNKGWNEGKPKNPAHQYNYGWWFSALHAIYKDKYLDIELSPLIDEQDKIRKSPLFLPQQELDSLILSIYNRHD